GYIRFEFTLPVSKDIATFDTAAMGWMSLENGYKWEVKSNPDGTQTLTAAKKRLAEEEGKVAIPGSGEVPVMVNVYKAKKGQIIQPTFKAWMDHNDVKKEVVADPVKVSAAPKYNVEIKKGSDIYNGAISTYDFSTGNEKALDKDAGTVYGKLQAYGISLQLYNDNKTK
uniref:hypothetical protein n=1 Tax=Mesomycoplasma ovipneumoniae TaxID=29562 RepID=UPI003080E09A